MQNAKLGSGGAEPHPPLKRSPFPEGEGKASLRSVGGVGEDDYGRTYVCALGRSKPLSYGGERCLIHR